MANKKLYSLRVDVDLLEALRAEADESGKTVSELITTYCRKGLEEDSKARDDVPTCTSAQSTKPAALASTHNEPVQIGTPLEIDDRVTVLIAELQSQIDKLSQQLQQSLN